MKLLIRWVPLWKSPMWSRQRCGNPQCGAHRDAEAPIWNICFDFYCKSFQCGTPLPNTERLFQWVSLWKSPMWSPQCGVDEDVEPPNVEPMGMWSPQYETFFPWTLLNRSPMWKPNAELIKMWNPQCGTIGMWSPQYGTPFSMNFFAKVPNVEPPIWSR